MFESVGSLVQSWEDYVEKTHAEPGDQTLYIPAKERAGFILWFMGGAVQESYDSACAMIVKCHIEDLEYWHEVKKFLKHACQI